MNFLVKQIINDDGEAVENPKWCVATVLCGDPAMLCTGNFLADAAASGNGELYEFKTVKRGGITCDGCLEMVRELKSITL